MGRRIVIASGKGGVGKSTITAGLGLALAKLGTSVVIIDGDVGLCNLDTLMELDGKVVFNLSDLMERKCRIKQALIQSEQLDNLYVLAGSSSRVGFELDEPARFSEITGKLAEVFDYVLIDSPAGASAGFKCCLSGADEALVVVTPHIVSIRDADKILGIISASGIASPMLVINRIRGDLAVSGRMLSHTQIEAVVNAKLVGIIPESDAVNIYSSLSFQSIVQKDITKSFWLLASSIHSNKRLLFDYRKKYKGLIGYLRRRLLAFGA